jgi:hypothetical protein
MLELPAARLRVAVAVLVALAVLVGARGAGAQDAPRRRSVWLTAGAGGSSFAPSAGLLAGWYSRGRLAVGVRGLVTGGGLNTSEIHERAVLAGGRLRAGPLLLVGAAGAGRTTGRRSNGEQSGTTSPVAAEIAPAAHVEATVALGRLVAVGVAGVWSGGRRSNFSGAALILQVGALR